MARHIIYADGGSKDVTHSWSTNVGLFGEVSYIENSRTHDTCRYTHRLPLTVTFTDSSNTRHDVIIESPSGQLTMVFPARGEIIWHGEERDRTGLDAQTYEVSATFHYEPGGTHGIRIMVLGYKLNSIGYYASDLNTWEKAIGLLVTGSEGVKNLAEAVAAARGGSLEKSKL